MQGCADPLHRPDREREIKKEGGSERESEIEKERVFILKGMTGALAPFNYIVQK